MINLSSQFSFIFQNELNTFLCYKHDIMIEYSTNKLNLHLSNFLWNYNVTSHHAVYTENISVYHKLFLRNKKI